MLKEPERDRAPVLRASGLSKSYGALRALREVSLEVARGEFVALLGPNGAGKTTLFQVLTGLFLPDAGEVEVNGLDMRRRAVAALARLGVVFQQATLDLDLSVEANLRFHARLHGLARARAAARIEEELRRLDLLEQRHDVCRRLSGGNRRRVELARALLHQPHCLLMDEATVGLDPAARRDIVDYVRALCDTQGTGLLWSTHLVDEAERADRILVLHRGELVASGTRAQLCEATARETLSDAFFELTGEAGSGDP